MERIQIWLLFADNELFQDAGGAVEQDRVGAAVALVEADFVSDDGTESGTHFTTTLFFATSSANRPTISTTPARIPAGDGGTAQNKTEKISSWRQFLQCSLILTQATKLYKL